MLNSIKEIKAAHSEHFFDESTLRFFNSRIMSRVVPTNEGAYFVTSERARSARGYTPARYYTLRFCDDSGNIETIGEFQQHRSARQAFASITPKTECKYIAYVQRDMPGDRSFELHRFRKDSEVLKYLRELERETGDQWYASLYPYTAENWQDAKDFETTGNPFDYPWKVSERGPRGGLKLVTA